MIVAAALLTACGNEEGSDQPGDAETGSALSSHESAHDAPSADTRALPKSMRPKPGRGSGKATVLIDVLLDEHKRFDRRVLEFSGNGTPGWRVNYVDEPTLEGGRDVNVD